MPYPMMEQIGELGGGSALPALAFGDFGPEDGGCGGGYNCGEVINGFGAGWQYDPSTGAYMPCEYAFIPYDGNCFNMMSQNQMQDEQGADDSTQVLLAALSDKMGDQIEVHGDATLEPNSGAPVSGNGEDMAGGGEIMESWEGATGDCWEGASWGHSNANYGSGNYGSAEDQQMGSMASQAPSNRRKNDRREREAARRQERAGGGVSHMNTDYNVGHQDSGLTGMAQWGHEAQNKASAGLITTVMFRNIPNKYTREMLVNQLEQDMRGQFDFIYLPIDFKNKCNVGYAFINFRTVEACESFVNRFNGVEVRKCLPGLNSRKVTEVTPARVQGFEENVQRLRNSPVMRELIHKPEWMPLIFDHNGEQIAFPSPERPLEPIKPRRRARDEEARLL